MSYSYIFPNEESQWDEVGYGSSADDPYPSTLFSALKHNKATLPACGLNIYHLTYYFTGFNRICKNPIDITISDFYSYVSSLVVFNGIFTGFNRICKNPIDITISDFYSYVYPNQNISYPQLPIIDTPCTFLHDLIPSFTWSPVESQCKSQESWHKPGINAVPACSIDINKSFDYDNSSNSTWCKRISNYHNNSIFSGCRSENIGLRSLQEEFGVEFLVIISCKYIPTQPTPKLSTVCNNTTDASNFINGDTLVIPTFSSDYTPHINRECNLVINAVVPTIEYGRINSMVMMPVFRDYGRISG